jgi:hypothetical protein
MKIKHIPKDMKDELDNMDGYLKRIIKDAIHKADNWKDAKKYIKRDLDTLSYQIQQSIKAFCD